MKVISWYIVRFCRVNKIVVVTDFHYYEIIIINRSTGSYDVNVTL